jgi:hypothetical protein
VASVEADAFLSGIQIPTVIDELSLRQAAETLTILASRANTLPVNEINRQLLDQLETALSILRRAFTDRSSGENSEQT